jgi:hypothetical protein
MPMDGRYTGNAGAIFSIVYTPWMGGILEMQEQFSVLCITPWMDVCRYCLEQILSSQDLGAA